MNCTLTKKLSRRIVSAGTNWKIRYLKSSFHIIFWLWVVQPIFYHFDKNWFFSNTNRGFLGFPDLNYQLHFTEPPTKRTGLIKCYNLSKKQKNPSIYRNTLYNLMRMGDGISSSLFLFEYHMMGNCRHVHCIYHNIINDMEKQTLVLSLWIVLQYSVSLIHFFCSLQVMAMMLIVLTLSK